MARHETLPSLAVSGLAGLEVYVSVGEPWDFEYPDDLYPIGGTVSSHSPPGTSVNEQRVVVAVTPFLSEEGAWVFSLTAKGRYVDEVGIVEHLVAGGRINANLHYND